MGKASNPADLATGSEVLEPLQVQRWKAGYLTTADDIVAVETPVSLVYNGISHAVMLASPSDLADFALGFSLTEGILHDASELYECEVLDQEQGMLVDMRIAAERFMHLKDKRRNLTGRTGCGLCGAESLEHAIRHPTPVNHQHSMHASLLFAGMHAMQKLQPLQQRSGATHAAAWMHADGMISCVREDVGRHNALDKLIGALIKVKTDFSQGAVLITSRASYEMVQKAASMNIGIIAALSAPTSLAIQLAKEANVTLAGFVKSDSHVIYAHHERILVN